MSHAAFFAMLAGIAAVAAVLLRLLDPLCSASRVRGLRKPKFFDFFPDRDNRVPDRTQTSKRDRGRDRESNGSLARRGRRND